jgi:serine/threonine protein kinase
VSDEATPSGPPTDGDPTRAIPASPAAAPSGWVLAGRYRVLERVGMGGLAEVFRAHDELLGREVAVKVFRTVAAQPDSPAGYERQQAELHALAQLNHPNLITLFDGSIATDSRAYLVMELVKGPTLAARLANGPLPEPLVRELGRQLAGALAYVHAHAMVHRDVKPANILLGSDVTTGDVTVRARLSDFGIVRLLGTERMTNENFALGTASYLAPEQARAADVGPAADVYSLGLVLLESITGVRAYDGPVLETLNARFLRSPDVPADLPYPWTALLIAMTAMTAADRPTAAQVGQALRDPNSGPIPIAVTTTAPLAAVPASAPGGTAAVAVAEQEPSGSVPARGRGRRRAALIAAAAVLAGLAVGAATLVRHPASGDHKVDQSPANVPITTGTHSISPSTSPPGPTSSQPSPTPSHSTSRSPSHPASTTHATPTPPPTSPSATPTSTPSDTTPPTGGASTTVPSGAPPSSGAPSTDG